jgi:hypothetical protein
MSSKGPGKRSKRLIGSRWTTGSLIYLVVMKGDYAALGVLMSLIGILPAFAMGQFLSLYGTRGVLHDIQAQNAILDFDTVE